MVHLIIYSLGAGIATMAGALSVLARGDIPGRTIVRLMGFGSGVLVATAFLHLIPGSVEMAPSVSAWAMLISFLVFIAIEQFIHGRACRDHTTCKVGVIGAMAFIALTVHSLVDGIAIAASLRVSSVLGLTTTLAVVAHEVPEGITAVSMFTAAGYRRRLTLLLSTVVAMATPVGALGAWFWTADVSDVTLAALLGVAAGSFIYVATADILPRLHEEQDKPAFLYLLLGVAIPVALLFLE